MYTFIKFSNTWAARGWFSRNLKKVERNNIKYKLFSCAPIRASERALRAPVQHRQCIYCRPNSTIDETLHEQCEIWEVFGNATSWSGNRYRRFGGPYCLQNAGIIYQYIPMAHPGYSHAHYFMTMKLIYGTSINRTARSLRYIHFVQTTAMVPANTVLIRGSYRTVSGAICGWIRRAVHLGHVWLLSWLSSMSYQWSVITDYRY
jgi:hypothetical protein